MGVPGIYLVGWVLAVFAVLLSPSLSCAALKDELTIEDLQVMKDGAGFESAVRDALRDHRFKIYRKGKNLSTKRPIRIRRGDRIQTDAETRGVVLLGKKRIFIAPRTSLRIMKVPDKIKAERGGFVVEIAANTRTVRREGAAHFSVETDYVLAAVIGTIARFSVPEKSQELDILVVEGQVRIISKTNRFTPIMLNAYDRFNSSTIHRKVDSMATRELGQGQMIYTPTGGSDYIARTGGMYDNYTGEQPGIFSGCIFPGFSSIMYDGDDAIAGVRRWIADIREVRRKGRVSGFEKNETPVGSAMGLEVDIPADSRSATPLQNPRYLPLTMFGFEVIRGDLYGEKNIGKPLDGRIVSDELARRCYGFSSGVKGNNIGDSVQIVHLGEGKVVVENTATGQRALLDTRQE